MTKNIVINTSNFFVAKRVLSRVRKRQNGKCHFCGVEFLPGDIIISCGHRRSYYHKSCAEQLHIL